jgi:GxxExxY protein
MPSRFMDERGNMGTVIDYPEQGLTRKIIGCAIEVHRVLGPGLLESTYRACLMRELELAGLSARQEVRIAFEYRGAPIECTYRADVVVADTVLLELKAVDELLPIHNIQLLTYLKLSRLRVGLLLNFNEPVLRQGVRRVVCRHPEH